MISRRGSCQVACVMLLIVVLGLPVAAHAAPVSDEATPNAGSPYTGTVTLGVYFPAPPVAAPKYVPLHPITTSLTGLPGRVIDSTTHFAPPQQIWVAPRASQVQLPSYQVPSQTSLQMQQYQMEMQLQLNQLQLQMQQRQLDSWTRQQQLQQYQIPQIPSMPSMPSIPRMPSLPPMPSIPSMPSMPSLPTFR